jgi:hypothetical protein
METVYVRPPPKYPDNRETVFSLTLVESRIPEQMIGNLFDFTALSGNSQRSNRE